MRNFDDYKKAIESEINTFYRQLPSSRGSAKGMMERLTKFLEITPKIEQHINSFCRKYFNNINLSKIELDEVKRINNELYNDFIKRINTNIT